MGSSPQGRLRRPWYLIVSLVMAWLLGALALMAGGSVITFYKQDADELEQALDHDEERVPDPDERALFRERTERLENVHDQAKRREFPLGVAALLLGGAMVATSARAMSGREGARGALVQVTLARAALAVAGFFLTPDVRAAEFAVANVFGYASISKVVLETAACLLVVIALTRPRSRAFFRAAEGSLWER
jgi:uncharacterized membrane protein YidH (DUF202 family)